MQKMPERGSTTSHFRRSTTQKQFEDDIQLNIKRGSNMATNKGIRSENGNHSTFRRHDNNQEQNSD